MNNKLIISLLLLLILNGCGATGTAFLGPAITGVTTKSVTRTSLSYGSNKVIRTVKKFDKNLTNK